MKIYTKSGDDGTTGLQGNRRVSKTNSRIMAYGMVDELNSHLGVILAEKIDEDFRILLNRIQNELFILGSDLSNPDLNDNSNRITEKMVENLETIIDKYDEELKPLTNFILPGGLKSAAQIHLARTVARRAEIKVVETAENDDINRICIKYLNRLSDLFFVLGRVLNKRNNVSDVIWNPKKDTL